MPLERLHVLHLVESFEGGVFNVLVQLCRSSDGAAFRHTILHAHRPKTPANARELFDTDIAMEELAMGRSLSPRGDLSSLMRVLSALRRLKPDVLHLHSSKAGAIGRLAAALLRIPCLYSPHGFSFLMLDASPRKRAAYRLIEKLLARLGGTIVACSETEYRHALSLGRAALINNGVDVGLLARILAEQREGRDGGTVTVGTSGRISFQKNPALFAALAERFPACRWIWIGEGELDRELKQAKVPIEITGWQDREGTLRRVADLDIYVQTSSWEGMPISVLEAMGLGKPVVATAVVGNQDLVRDGATGFLGSDLEGLALGMARLVSDPALRERQGKAGRDRVLAEFDALRKIEEWESLYRRTALRRKVPAAGP